MTGILRTCSRTFFISMTNWGRLRSSLDTVSLPRSKPNLSPPNLREMLRQHLRSQCAHHPFPAFTSGSVVLALANLIKCMIMFRVTCLASSALLQHNLSRVRALCGTKAISYPSHFYGRFAHNFCAELCINGFLGNFTLPPSGYAGTCAGNTSDLSLSKSEFSCGRERK